MIPKRTRRLRARAATINHHDDEFEDYGPEPNMKLSHAFMIVLLLHLVAVGGLYIFNSMKAGKTQKAAVARSVSPQGGAPEQVGGNEPGSGDGNKAPQEPKEPKDPREDKAAVVAKASEAPKVSTTEKATASDATGTAQPNAVKATRPQNKGFLAGAKSALLKATGLGATAASVGTVSAQNATVAAGSNPPTQEPASVPAIAGPKTYIVKAGDTITRISSSLGVTIPDLEKVNGIAGNAVLRVGQVLKVPEKAIVQAAGDVASQAGKMAESVGQLPSALAATAGSVAGAVQGAVGGTNATAGSVAATGTEYTVAKGDSPYKIAKKFKITPDELMKANSITDPKKIQIGQKLTIPASSKKAAK